MAPGTTRTMTAVIPPGQVPAGMHVLGERHRVLARREGVGSPVARRASLSAGDLQPDRPVWSPSTGPRCLPALPSGLRHRPPPVLRRCGQLTASEAGLAGGAPRLRPPGGRLRHLRGLQRRDRRTPQRPSAGCGRSGLDRVPPARVRPVAEPAGADVARWPTAGRRRPPVWWQRSRNRPSMPNDLSLRTHEILENTLQFEFTGETDQGSHTGLATALANVQGTEMTSASSRRCWRQRDPALLARPQTDLHQLAALLGYLSAARRHVDPRPVSHLAQRQPSTERSATTSRRCRPFPTCSSSRPRRRAHDRRRPTFRGSDDRSPHDADDGRPASLSRRGFLRAWRGGRGGGRGSAQPRAASEGRRPGPPGRTVPRAAPENRHVLALPRRRCSCPSTSSPPTGPAWSSCSTP